MSWRPCCTRWQRCPECQRRAADRRRRRKSSYRIQEIRATGPQMRLNCLMLADANLYLWPVR